MRTFKTMAEQVAWVREFAANPSQRVRFGFPSLDALVEGPAEGEVFTIMGRSHAGKSNVGLNILANNADLGMVFFSMEMPSRQAVQRLYAMSSSVSAYEVHKQVMSNALPYAFDAWAESMEKHVLVDDSKLTIGDMTAVVDQYEAYFGERPAAVVVDYLELLNGGKYNAEGWQRTEATAGDLKAWAKSEHMPVFLLHQTNKTERKWEPPNENSGRGGGYTEADVVIGLWRPGADPDLGAWERKELERTVRMNVLKNRVTGKMPYSPIEFEESDSLRLLDVAAIARRHG